MHLGYASLSAVEAAPPTAELEPIREGTAAQTDEQDMGMTYEVQLPRLRQGQWCPRGLHVAGKSGTGS